MLRTEIAEYHWRGAETGRLAEGRGLLEYLRTLDVLTRALPPAPARVLDVGGATGVYAAALTDAGYRVHVVDPVPEHVERSAARPGVTAALGDARRLAEEDSSVDAMLLGPLYHLGGRLDAILDDPAERKVLLAMLRRVEAEPTLLAASSHLLGIGRRR